MRVLLTGATGFLGQHIQEKLLNAGYQIVCTVRTLPTEQDQDTRLQYIAADFMRDVEESTWLPRLNGVDVVINAAGILRENDSQTFTAIHVKAPCALFSACKKADVKLVIQISALGADAAAHSRYHRSKKEADDFLAALSVRSIIVQPSLIYGDDGTSAQLFTMLASMPIIVLPSGGKQIVQPVHIEDVTSAILALLNTNCAGYASGTRFPVVGPTAVTLRDYLLALRTSMQMEPCLVIPIPLYLMHAATGITRFMLGSLLDRETLDMLERGNTADSAPLHFLLGRPPISVEKFIGRSRADIVRKEAQLRWLLPILRFSIAVVWMVTGIVSAGVFPITESYQLLERVGIVGVMAPLMLYGAALLDGVFGIATLVLKQRYWLWIAQLAVIVFYTAVITWKLPEFWLHPYGPLLKNLPMAAAIWLLMKMER
jgi:uncharacterized protein YbjT (DUF2867 family)